MLVSVVVPVYNGGEYLDRCAPSLLEQSLPVDAYEVIYVDDGSTDDSADRLARIAARYPHVRVIHQENSGWPGKPRNVGIEESTAEYVQFVDQDDELAPEALERLYALGHRNSADIVLGKMGGSMTGPNSVFRRTVETATLAEIDAINTLTGHKMFRRAFLDEHRIRFAEGYWRMEDLLFVTRAYAHNPRLSVLGDYVCYWWNARDDGGNHSRADFDLAAHYQRLAVIIATLRDALEPGPATDDLLRRYYRIETMSRVSEAAVAGEPDGPWRVALPLLAEVARTSFPPGVRDGLPAVRRLRARLVEAEDADGLLTLSQRISALNPVIERRDLGFDDAGVLRASLRLRLTWPADGDVAARPLALVQIGDDWQLDPALTAGLGDLDAFPVADPLRAAYAEVRLEDAERRVWWYPDSAFTAAVEPTADGAHQVVVAGELAVDPTTAAAGQPLAPGAYEVWLWGEILGVGRRRRLVVPKAARTEPVWQVYADAPVVARLDWSTAGAKLRLEVRDRQEWLAEELRPLDQVETPQLVDLPVRCPAQLPAGAVEVTLSIADRPVSAQLLRSDTPGTATLRLPATSDLPAGRHTALVAGSFHFLAQVESKDGTLRWSSGLTLGGLLRPPPRTPAPAAEPPSVLRRLVRRLRG